MRDEDDPVVQRVAGTGLDQLKQTKIENVLTHKEKLKPSLQILKHVLRDPPTDVQSM